MVSTRTCILPILSSFAIAVAGLVTLGGCQTKEKPSASPPAPAAPAAVTDSTPAPARGPAAPPAGSGAPPNACDTLVVQLDRAGVWVGAPPDVRCYGIRKTGAVDTAWLAAELQRLHTALAATKCPSAVQIGAGADLPYQDVITTIDTARRVGFTQVAVAQVANLAMTFPAPPAATTSCDAAVQATAPTGTAPGGATASARTHVSPDTTIIVISETTISVNRAPASTVADAASGTGPLSAIAAALGTAKGNKTLILQAVPTTSAQVINRVIESAKQAGYDDVVFALKR